ncbi:unnamed protein product [Dovyalis caffra]|uniref:Uncharacterized protein n=1 Tax=Dovyalis caffra TaxID=77055 RepID=A0AAV1RIW2_9ROSI|nr:unnamed protein product [Dovyalis caffra]
MVVDTGGVVTISISQANVMEYLAIPIIIGMNGISLTLREATVVRIPLMIEKQATTVVEESSVIIFLIDGQASLTAADMEIGTRRTGELLNLDQMAKRFGLLLQLTSKGVAIASSSSVMEALLVNQAFCVIHCSDVVALVIEAMTYITK